MTDDLVLIKRSVLADALRTAYGHVDIERFIESHLTPIDVGGDVYATAVEIAANLYGIPARKWPVICHARDRWSVDARRVCWRLLRDAGWGVRRIAWSSGFTYSNVVHSMARLKEQLEVHEEIEIKLAIARLKFEDWRNSQTEARDNRVKIEFREAR